ncbi:GM19991 [Drosophila sechellia]|uniref:GM19991 n=1 Tax=Drosophila sechellia TaxID=7238 RepID=B4HMK1_DROSE|nr:GM19991 [Drosophila sechellia]
MVAAAAAKGYNLPRPLKRDVIRKICRLPPETCNQKTKAQVMYYNSNYGRTPVQAVGLQPSVGQIRGHQVPSYPGSPVLAKLKVKQRRESKLSLKVNKRGAGFGPECHLSFQGSRPGKC